MNKKGFTLIELLVVVLIIGVLSAVALPGYRKAMEKAKAAEAIQALSDISKSQHDYYLARNRYTNDFSDLVLTMKGKNTLDNEDSSSYATEHFVYNLDDDQDLATASRERGADSYTLYRFYEDPITYCEPEGNKYCEMLGLVTKNRAGQSVGNWQSCPGGVYPCSMACSRGTTTGYNCYGTYNEDGTFTERVCSPAPNDQMSCTLSYYGDNGKIFKRTICTLGDGLTCNSKVDIRYDGNGNMVSRFDCTTVGSDGTCSQYSGSPVYFYDDNGNLDTIRICSSFKDDGSCSSYYASTYGAPEYATHLYDSNHRLVAVKPCKNYDSSDGACTEYYDTGTVYTYDSNGNKTLRLCDKITDDGGCSLYSNTGVNRNYTYDTNGNMTEAFCQEVDTSNGNCIRFSGGDYHVYDANGKEISRLQCTKVASDGTCSEIGTSGNIYTYDNGRIIYATECNNISQNGSCNGTVYGRYEYQYDANGNQNGVRRCEGVQIAGDGTCIQYRNQYADYARGINYDYLFDENGNKIMARTCRNWSGTTCTDWSNYSGYATSLEAMFD